MLPPGLPSHIDRWVVHQEHADLLISRTFDITDHLKVQFAHKLSALHCRPVQKSDVIILPRGGEDDDGYVRYTGYCQPSEDRNRRWHTAVARAVSAQYGTRAEAWWFRYETADLSTEERYQLEVKAYHEGSTELLINGPVGNLAPYHYEDARLKMPDLRSF